MDSKTIGYVCAHAECSSFGAVKFRSITAQSLDLLKITQLPALDAAPSAARAAGVWRKI